MNIQQLIDIDKQVTLFLNGSDSLYMDGVMYIFSSTIVWVPLAIVILFVLKKNTSLLHSILLIAMIAVTVLLCDRISSGVFKPYFQRFRPTQDPTMMDFIQTVNGYRSGKYGFISSHASNSFGLFVFLSLLIKNKGLTISLLVWAFLNSFTRIYLGVHFVGDVLAGMIFGCIVGLVTYYLYRLIYSKIEHQPVRYTSYYTSSGFLVEDVQIIQFILYLSYVFISIYAFIFINNILL